MEQFPRGFGAYRLTRRIAGGGFGVVYEAQDVASPGRRLALKTLRPEVGHTPQAAKRLLHEATVARAIDHPNVVQVVDAGFEGETPFVVMALVEGWSLAEVLRRLNARAHVLDWRAAINLLAGALGGLDAIHRAVDPQTGEPLGIVHRDLAPKNLMVNLSGELVVIDLGLGKSTVQDWATATGSLMGTPGYMSPEQVRGGRVDLRSDIYSMGVISFELLTMQRYIPPGDPLVIMRQTLSGPARRLSSVRPELPPALDDLVARATAIEVEGRFPSMAQFRDQLLAVSEGSTVQLCGLPIWQELLVAPPPAVAEVEPATEPSAALPESITALEPETHGGTVVPTAKVDPPQSPRAPLPVPGLVGGLALASLLLVVALGRPMEREAPAPVIIPPLPSEPPQPPTVTVTVKERPPSPDEDAPAAAPSPPAPPASPPPAADPPKSTAPRGLAKVEPPTPKLSARIDLLVTRASRLKSARPELAPALNRIIGEASLWRGAKEEPETQAQVKALEVQLSELEARSVTRR